jgi:gluconokinase
MIDIDKRPQLVIVMGVAGSGKSTLAALLAKQLGWAMIEADSYHSEQAVSLMKQGIPLNDEIRKEWIIRLRDAANNRIIAGSSVVMAYSGLKHHQRQQFNTLNCQTTFLFLNLPFDVLQARLAKRTAHFFPTSLLQSQFDDLEPLKNEANEYTIDANKPVEDILRDCLTCIEDTRGQCA